METQTTCEQLLILRTDISSEAKVDLVRGVLDGHPDIQRWSIDLWDVDFVLRIEARRSLSIAQVSRLLEPFDLFCEDLPE